MNATKEKEYHNSEFLLFEIQLMEKNLAGFRKWGVKNAAPQDDIFKILLYDYELQLEALRSLYQSITP